MKAFEGNLKPLKLWDPLIVQLVKNYPAMQDIGIVCSFSIQACVCLNLREESNVFFLSNFWLPSVHEN